MTLYRDIKREEMLKNQWSKFPYPEASKEIANETSRSRTEIMMIAELKEHTAEKEINKVKLFLLKC